MSSVATEEQTEQIEETKTEAPLEVEAPKEEAAPETPAETEGEKTEETKSEEDAPRGNHRVEKRIHKLTRKLSEQEARHNAEIEALRAQFSGGAAQADDKPKRDGYESDEAFIDALTDYKIGLRDKQNQTLQNRNREAKEIRDWETKLEKARDKYDDLDDLIEEAPSETFDGAVIASIRKSDVGGDLYHYLLKNPDEARRIAGLDPIDAVRAIGRIESRFVQQGSATKKGTTAPAPIKPVGARATVGTVDPEKETPKEYAARRNREIAERSRVQRR